MLRHTLWVLVLAIPLAPAMWEQILSAQAAASATPHTGFGADDALSIVTARVGALSDDGRWVAILSSSRRDGLGVDHRRDGDPTYVRPNNFRLQVTNTETRASRDVFSAARNVQSVAWSPDASRLAVLVARGDDVEALIWERETGRTRPLRAPAGQYVAEGSDVRWSRDGQRILVRLRSLAQRQRIRAQFERQTKGPVFVQSTDDPFLAWDELRRLQNLTSIAAIDVGSGRATDLLAEAMTPWYAVTEDDSLLVWQSDITGKTDYDVIFGTENRLFARRLAGGAPFQVLPSLKGTTIVWSRDGRRYATGKDGRVHLGTLGDTARRLVAGPPPGDSAGRDSSATGRERRANERFTPLRFSPAGDALLLSNRQGLWTLELGSGQRSMIVERNDSLATSPRYTPAAWSPDGRYIYLNYASRTKWERGLVRYDRTAGRLQELVKDGKLYGAVVPARDRDRAIIAIADGNRPSDLYVADGTRPGFTRLTDANPQLASRRLATTSLSTFRDADGVSRYAVVYYPPDHKPSTRSPTVFSIYEDFFDDTFDPTANVLTANGYVVVKPSVGFDIGYPGEAWLKGVTASANALIDAGVADSARLGVHGISYGGYATNLLITQTTRFKAAINISGKVDVISFYTDSPRLGVRNIHAAEKSQDRLGATLWEQPQKYVAQSAIMFADRIKTPLLLMTGEQDSNVPAGNTREMYYALRRLGKPVTWVNYMNGGHGTPATTAADFTDFHQRILDFYARHLKSEGTRVVEATSLFGEPLIPSAPSAATKTTLEGRLATARAAYARTPLNADSIIWYGRRTAYLGRYNEAIAIFSEGIAAHPNDARMYRHRGHRYISVRRFDDAIRDFETATRLIAGKADEVEPDGAPNARNIPTSTLKSNIWYHLGLAYYLKGDFANALRAYRADMKVSTNPDMQVATSHWLYMTLRRLGREKEAAEVLVPIRKEMDIIENQSYHRLLLVYKGELSADSLLGAPGAEGSELDLVSSGYGLANWHLYNGRRAEAEAVLQRVLEVRSQWPAFGYLAAEAELKRLGISPKRLASAGDGTPE